MQEIIFSGKRLDEERKYLYLEQLFSGKDYTITKEVFISGVTPLLQNDFGKNEQNCTLTSIACNLKYLTHQDINKIYFDVRKVAATYFYDPEKLGTIPIFTKSIMRDLKNIYNLNKTARVRFGNNIFFTYKDITELIDADIPVLISLVNDGRNCYKRHTVLIVGYQEFSSEDKTARFLRVYDNWSLDSSYIDYDKLNILSSINYYN